MQQGLYSKPGGYLKFQEDMALIEERYNSEPRKGVEAESILLEFIQSKETVRISICRTNQSPTALQLKQEEDNPNTQLKKRENRLKELKLANNGVIEESKQRTIGMHLPKLLIKAKNDNSKREEILDRIIQSKSMERNMYNSGGFTTYARTYEKQIDYLSREKTTLKDPAVLQEIADFFMEYAVEIICIPLIIVACLIKIIVF